MSSYLKDKIQERISEISEEIKSAHDTKNYSYYHTETTKLKELEDEKLKLRMKLEKLK